jgi:type IV pilus assembly protein PilC
MLAAGIPLVQAFEIVGNGHENAAMQKLILGIKADVEGGSALAEALAKQPLYFDDLFVNLVEAGEQAGALETLLDKIATYKEKTEAIKKKIKKALTYPAAVIVVALVVTTILLIFVIPAFEDLFQGFGADLPTFTRMVIDLSVFRHRLLPLFQEAVPGDATLPRSHVPENSDHRPDPAESRRCTLRTHALDDVRRGRTAGRGSGIRGRRNRQHRLRGRRPQDAGRSRNWTKTAASHGEHGCEESGSLDDMSAKVADFYEEDVDNAVDNLSSLLEPLIMSILGVLVGGLVVAMYLPIFKMGSVI